jgi:hypothetical protein
MENSLEKPALNFHVDPEHGALRLSIIGIFVGLWVITFFVLILLVPAEGANLIALVVGFVIAAIVSRQIENTLRARWPSGRLLVSDENRIALLLKDVVEFEIATSEPMSILLWRFRIRRRTRVPKGWHVVACAIEQEDTYLPVYTFMSPQDADALNGHIRFPALMTEKETQQPAGHQDSLRTAGEQRRLRKAEQYRWASGAEMTNDDFRQFLEHLNEQFPQWMSVNR